MPQSSDLPILSFATPKAWEGWVSKHLTGDGLWLKIAKQGARTKSVTYQEALEVALCYGWIDGQKKTLDHEYWLQRFGPRGPRSIWSKINRDKARKLEQEGRMKPAGLAAIGAAKRSGQWDRAYEGQKIAEPPVDLLKALKARPKAAAFFKTLDSRNRYSVLFRIHNAKKAETRATRIEKFVTMLERHEKIYP